MTTATKPDNSIMAYVGVDGDVSGVSGTSALPDWEGSNVYFFQTSFIGPGLRRFDIDPDGDETLSRSKVAIGVTEVDTGNGGAACLSPSGDSIVFISETGNSVRLAKVNTSDFTLAAQFGASSSTATPSTSSRILGPQMLVSQGDGGEYLTAACANNTGEVDSIAIAGFSTNTNLGNMDTGTPAQAGGLLGRGDGANRDGPIFAVELPFRDGVVSAGNQLAIHLYTVSATTLTHKGSFGYLDVDVTWTGIVGARGLALDETDGNPLIAVQSLNAAANQFYIMKLNGTNGAILWKRAVSQLPPYSWGMANSRIRHQMYHFLNIAGLVYHIDTSDGSVTTETFDGLNPTGVQCSDDVTNSVILYGSFSATGTQPTYLGSYMDTAGHHSVSGFMRVWFATEPAMGEDPPGTGGRMGGLAQSELRAWTYTLDKHKFYVLDLGPEGTWVFDLTTTQWSKFWTDGYAGRWDATNGVMWQKRVIAGDLESTDVWEIAAAAMQDNDELDITHVVTGGVLTRSRDAVTCDRVSVAATVGKLAGSSSTLRLRFSDDGGNSWSGYFDAALTQADHTVWADFIGLGSFAAPGRVFEISDVGGPVRIDGADALLGGEDGKAG